MSTGRNVLWTKNPLDQMSCGRKIRWTKSRLDEMSCGRKIRWTKSRLDEMSCGRKFCWTKCLVDEKSVGRNVLWTKSQVDELSLNEMSVDEIFVDEMSRGQNFVGRNVVSPIGRHSNVMDVRAYKEEKDDTDHWLVITKLKEKLCIANRERKGLKQGKFEVKLLKNPGVKPNYEIHISNRFEITIDCSNN